MRSKAIARSASLPEWTTIWRSRRSRRISTSPSRERARSSALTLEQERDGVRELLVVAFFVVDLRGDAQHLVRRRRLVHDRHFDLVLEEDRVLQLICIERGGRDGEPVWPRKRLYRSDHVVGCRRRDRPTRAH